MRLCQALRPSPWLALAGRLITAGAAVDVTVPLCLGGPDAAAAASEYRVSPLLLACQPALGGSPARLVLVRKLMDAGVALDVWQGPPHAAYTPLAAAAMHGDVAICEALLEAGADASMVCGDGCTALQLAEAGGHAGVVALLLRASSNSEHPAELASAGAGRKRARSDDNADDGNGDDGWEDAVPGGYSR